MLRAYDVGSVRAAVSKPPRQQVRGRAFGEEDPSEGQSVLPRPCAQAGVVPIRAAVLIGKQKRIKMPHFLNYARLL